jgi:hypothetical protein
VIPAEVHFYAGRQITRPEMRDVDYYIEDGGRVTVMDANSTLTIITTATVIGTITDSTAANAGLAGAVVRLMGEPDSTVTDSSGIFRLTTHNAGTQTIIATHPKLALIADSSIKEVHLSLGSSTRANFAVPSAKTFIREFCGKADPLMAGLVGRALSSDGVGREGLDVVVTWAVAGPAGRAVNGQFHQQHAETGPNGIYVICELPSRTEFLIFPAKDSRSSSKTDVHLGEGEYKWVDFRVSLPPPG